MWEPISPRCLVTKITNDSVHFIPLAGFALPLDTHWFFQCELASWVLCCCSVWPHRLVCLFWYLLRSLSGAWPHSAFEHRSEGLTHFGEFSLFLHLWHKTIVYRDWQPLTTLYLQQVVPLWIHGFYNEDLCLISEVYIGSYHSAWKTHHQGEVAVWLYGCLPWYEMLWG